MGEPATGVWVYGVVAAPDGRWAADDADGPEGVAGAPLRVVEAGGMAAVVATVDLTGFGVTAEAGFEQQDGIDASVLEPGVLEQAAWKHHDVLTMLARRGASVPLRLATVYRDDSRVVLMLRRYRAELSAALAMAAGKTEWGVKGWVDSGFRTVLATSADHRSGPGAAYLLRRRDQLRLAERTREEIGRYAAGVHKELSAVATLARRFPVPELGDLDSEQVFFSGAYLVPDDRGGQFSAAVQGLPPTTGMRVAVTGPWPPYTVGFSADPDGG